MTRNYPLLILKAMRPRQWVKNILLFAGLFFAQKFLHLDSVLRALEGFASFCLVSGAVYVLNDVVDVERDRIHPRKRLRPVASGALPIPAAVVAALLAGFAGLWAAWTISEYFFMCTAAYAVLMVTYSFYLKNVFLIDTIIIAMGFMIRAVSGVIVLRTPTLAVPLTSWFVICVMFLSLLIAFCKRRSEQIAFEVDSHQVRPVLAFYSVPLLDSGINICAAGALLSYALYSVYTPERSWMMLTTLPFVMFGIFRYLHLVYAHQEGEAPELVLLHDFPMLGCVVLWLLSLGLVYLPG